MVKAQKEDAYIVGEVWMDSTIYTQYYASGIDSFFDFEFADKDGVIAKTVNGISKAASYGKNLVNIQELLKNPVILQLMRLFIQTMIWHEAPDIIPEITVPRRQRLLRR